MNIEVEIKVKIDNFEEIAAKVRVAGELVKKLKQVDDYYIPCHRDFFAAKPHPTEWLRIRTNPDKTIFEYDRSMDVKEDGSQAYAEEYETGISDVDEFRKILGFLDFKKVVTIEKQREYWMCGDIEVALDRIARLGDFIEAEAKGDFKDADEAKKACVTFLEKLGIEDVEFKFFKSKNTIREKFLNTITPFKFRIRSLVVDKEKIYSYELKYNKNSFYSYIIKMVLKYNDDSIMNAKVKIDGSGDRVFRRNFLTYLRRELNTGDRKIINHCRLVDSRSNVLVQMADMIAGTIRRSYDEDKEDGILLKRIIKKHIQDEWSFK